jgi:type II secretory pathway pseudopilin PulG
MEILVVVVIALLMAGVALPSFARSLQGQRLRHSARTFVIAHKYARNMAVLQQTRMAVLIDRGAGKVEVVSIPSRDALAGRGNFLEGRGAEPAAEDEPPAEGSGGGSIEILQGRALGRNVTVADFSTAREGQEIDGIYWVNYHPSGMSDGFTVTITDERGRKARIEADAFSGGVEVEFL